MEYDCTNTIGSELLLDRLAKSIDYDYAVFKRTTNSMCSIAFGYWDSFKLYDVRYEDGHKVVVDDNDSIGSIVIYDHIAKEIYRQLSYGKKLLVDGKQFSAESVPRFMIECVLSGLSEGETNGR